MLYQNITIFYDFQTLYYCVVKLNTSDCCCCCQLLSRQSRSRSCPHHVLSCPEALAAGAEIKKQSRSELNV